MTRTLAIISVALLAGCNLFSPTAENFDPDSGSDAGDMQVADGGSGDMGTSDGGGSGDMNSCVPEGPVEFCLRLGKNCGLVSGVDTCGSDRQIDCGSCEEPCGEVEENVCGCPCDIDGECYVPGELNPDDPCLLCDPESDSADWTLNEGASCDDGNPCSSESRCNAGGNCAPIDFDGCEQLASECEVGACDEQTMSCVVTPVDDGIPCTDDGLACTTDACMTGSCEHLLDEGTCVIDGVCYDDGDANPDSDCQICDPTTSSSAWTNRAMGDACSDGDGLSCTSGSCNGSGTCEAGLQAGNCLINGVCYSDGTDNPANSCQTCDSATSTTQFSAKSDGAGCASAFSCTTGSCQSGQCQESIDSGSCLIASTCYAAGTDDPSNECHTCDPTTSQTDWSDKPVDTVCGDQNNCTCDAGACLRSNGNAC